MTKIKTIGKNSFKNTKITTVSLPKSLENLESTSFDGCQISSFQLEDGNQFYKYDEIGAEFLPSYAEKWIPHKFMRKKLIFSN